MKTTTKYCLGTICIWLGAVFCAFNFAGGNEFDLARQEVMLRRVGHQILLHSGDSTSRVLPVKRVAENEYQLTFENEFTFQPDSLVGIIRRSLAQNKLSDNYIINVLNCTGGDVVFGYAILGNGKDDIAACSGRRQPKSCYRINLKFENKGVSITQKVCMLGGIPLLAFVGFLMFGPVKPAKKKVADLNPADNGLMIGNTLFDPGKRQLLFDQFTTDLTVKENKLLLILAASANKIVERNRLQKEIWEDEGVIVGRSLDVFISKLRKKLECDSTIKLSNIHGKGYKLETTNVPCD